MAQCLICGKDVAFTDQTEHLRSNHLGPHYFWFDGKKHRTVEPSMTGAQIKALVGATSGYQLLMDKDDGDTMWIPDGMAVDLTRKPHFWYVPPATY